MPTTKPHFISNLSKQIQFKLIIERLISHCSDTNKLVPLIQCLTAPTTSNKVLPKNFRHLCERTTLFCSVSDLFVQL